MGAMEEGLGCLVPPGARGDRTVSTRVRLCSPHIPGLLASESTRNGTNPYMTRLSAPSLCYIYPGTWRK